MLSSTLITTPFTAESTAAEVVSGVNLAGRRAIVTGAASGIGVETVRALAVAGAEVTLAVRDRRAGERMAGEISQTTGNRRIRVGRLDLADPASVAAFVAAWEGPLHILVNNAGVMGLPEIRTADGWELTFATNHLGHFALATGLHRALAAAGGGRVVSVTSGAHLNSPVVFDDIHFRRRRYDARLAYGQSKTANVLFAVEATRRWADDGITVNAAMPGGIRTGLQRYMDAEQIEEMYARVRNTPGMRWKTPQQGAATSVLLAASPLLVGVGGRYFEDCAEAGPHQESAPGAPLVYRGVAGYALDPEAAERLWRVSLDMLES